LPFKLDLPDISVFRLDQDDAFGDLLDLLSRSSFRFGIFRQSPEQRTVELEELVLDLSKGGQREVRVVEEALVEFRKLARESVIESVISLRSSPEL
jgi:hypothetical protein